MRDWNGRCQRCYKETNGQLASAITLESGDGVWVEGDDAPIFGEQARAALARLQRVEESPQVAVNEQQTALGIPTAIGEEAYIGRA